MTKIITKIEYIDVDVKADDYYKYLIPTKHCMARVNEGVAPELIQDKMEYIKVVEYGIVGESVLLGVSEQAKDVTNLIISGWEDRCFDIAELKKGVNLLRIRNDRLSQDKRILQSQIDGYGQLNWWQRIWGKL